MLRETDHIARDVLHDARDPERFVPVLRGWVEVIECAAGAWSSIPAGTVGRTPPDGGHPLPSIRAIARDINRTLSRVDDDHAVEQRMQRIADLLAGIADSVSIDLPSSRTLGDEATTEAATLRTGILHACYLLTHATAVSLAGGVPKGHKPGVGEWAEFLATLGPRISSAEQTLAAHLSHRVPWSEVSADNPVLQLVEALDRWDRAVHDIARSQPDPKNLAVVADVNLGLLSHSARLSLASAEAGHLSPIHVSQRLLPAIARATHTWEVTRTDWTTLASPQVRLSRELMDAARGLRRALAEPVVTMHPGTPSVLTLALAAGQEAAILLRQAMAEPGLRVPADTVVRLTAHLAERHPEQVSFKTWTRLERLHGRMAIPLPDAVRHDLVANASATVEAAATARSAGHVLHQSRGNEARETFEAVHAIRAVRPNSMGFQYAPQLVAARDARTR